jgi:choline dehydrogenase-like flavoprotein
LLESYYDRAEQLVGIRGNCRVPELPVGLVEGDAISPIVFHTQQKSDRHWGIAFGGVLETAPNVSVYLNAHLIGLEQSGRRISRVFARDAQNREIAVQSRFVVLAAGGIENARLLLLSKLGNEHDQVGRYYMDHPKARIGIVETYHPLERFWGHLTEDAPIYVGFRLNDDVQRTERILNSHVLLQPLFERDLARLILRRIVRPKRCRVMAVRNYLEQEPNPDNRVFLSAVHRDPYGLPLATVTWTVSELDRRTMAVFHRVLLRELQRCGIGELRSPLLRGDFRWNELTDASHHMGTTRMATDPKDSVVDPHCRVHDLDNLYIAGSSVFPTSGYANPTATIAALALRLADHLKSAA